MFGSITIDSCRICLHNSGTMSIFIINNDNEESFADMIMKCSSVTVNISYIYIFTYTCGWK